MVTQRPWWAAFLALACLFLAVFAGLQIRSELLVAPLRTEIGFWGREEYRPDRTTRERVDMQLQQFLSRAPDDRRLLELRAAQLYNISFLSPGGAQRGDLRAAAASAQLASLRRRPAHADSWRKLALYTPSGERGSELRLMADRRLRALRQELL